MLQPLLLTVTCDELRDALIMFKYILPLPDGHQKGATYGIRITQ